ncbi:acyltransferase family protein [Rhizobium herbae]|uniref:Peptidoglycan/LPS O-acetylase OafA/YrhL n=1 Tax=Rhizobium herbae TaxID=508661 RepID=A0ABS4ERU8_9HYPH|nr:acyltransferase [Rhizobium herbae]MBP1860669.1 peptidoglycan/LPS O-acetylase OafA/YrhL [Rhizobium herbae]
MAYNFRDIKYIPGLDGIRFFAVSIVLVSHFGFGKWVPGGFGVTIFFFLSGFLITTLLIQESLKKGSISIGHFYIRRFLRLGPEMIVLLIGSTIISRSMGLSPSFGDIAAALTYTTNYYILYLQSVAPDGIAHVWWPHLWSLAVEEHYYLTFPLIFGLIFGRPKFLFLFFLVSLSGCLAWRYFVIVSEISGSDWQHAYGYLASEARLDSIAYGALFAFVAQRPQWLSSSASGAALAAGLILLLACLLVRDEFFRETLRYSLQGIGIFLVFSHLYLARNPSWLNRISNFGPLRIGGVLSYGAYLWHMEFLRVTYHIFNITPAALPIHQRVPFAIAGFACAFGVAWLSYRYVAKPVLRFRANFGSHAAVGAPGMRPEPVGPSAIPRETF